MAIPQASKRISKLPLLDGDEIQAIQERTVEDEATDPGGITYTHSDAWGIGVDSLCRNDGTAIGPGGLIPGMHVGPDDGTAFIPMSRIAMRDTNGKIPSSMLPGHIDDMIFGTLDVTDPSVTKFREPPPTGATTGHVYASPTQGTGELPPPENVIFCDTTTSLQYRYIQSQAQTYNDTVKHGFTEVPGSRALTSTYGINIVLSQSNSEVIVNAKYPKQFIGKINASTQDVSNEPKKFGNLTLDMNGIRGINATVGTDHWTFDGLIDTGSTEYIRYHMNIELKCWPSQGQSLRTADIITLKIVRYTNAAKTTYETMSSCRYDMSSLADSSDPDIIKFAFDFVTNANTESFAILGEQNQQVTVSVNRVSLVELL